MDTSESQDDNPRRHSIDQELARLMSPMLRGSHIDPEWRAEALCAEYSELTENYDLWFAEESTFDARDASKICFSCPVREKCLEWASLTKQREGIWGGQPSSIRLKHKGKPHNYLELVNLPNPYDTDSTKNRFHNAKLSHKDGTPSPEESE